MANLGKADSVERTPPDENDSPRGALKIGGIALCGSRQEHPQFRASDGTSSSTEATSAPTRLARAASLQTTTLETHIRQ